MTTLRILPILAQREAWESLGNRFSGEYTTLRWEDLATLAIVLVSVGLLILLLRWLYSRQQARQLSNDPEHLFVDLCRAHYLNRRERRLLRDLAEYANLPQHAHIFIRPDLFQEQMIPEELGGKVPKYELLSQKLFRGIDKLAPQANVGTAQFSADA